MKRGPLNNGPRRGSFWIRILKSAYMIHEPRKETKGDLLVLFPSMHFFQMNFNIGVS